MLHAQPFRISNIFRKTLIPIINKHCADGTVFCSDSWKAYYKLPEHLDLQDVLYFPVNHTNNYVDPVTGAHTQTIKGIVRLVYVIRYCKKRKLDIFMEMMKCILVEVTPFQSSLPIGTRVKRTEDMKNPDFV